MKQAPHIQFIGMEPSDSLASATREKAAKLELLCPEIMTCHVAIEVAHKHSQQGRAFAVRVDLTLPGRELAISRVENEDAYVALRGAFDNMKRQIEATMRQMREPLKETPIGAAQFEGQQATS
jgi:ribosome-associated translation inhibitor RaiA